MLRVFLDDCLARLMAGELDATTAAIAKLNATEIQGKALDELLQLYGGYGYMAEYGIGRAWSDARALRLFGGTSEIMRRSSAAASPETATADTHQARARIQACRSTRASGLSPMTQGSSAKATTRCAP